MNIKKMIAVAASTVMTYSFLASGVMDAKRVTDSGSANGRSTSDEPSIEAVDSLGKCITNLSDLNNKKSSSGLTASAAEQFFALSALSFDPDSYIASVESTQSQSCTLRVTITDDITKNEVATAKVQIGAGRNTVTNVKVPVLALPEYYLVTATLVSSSGVPLSASFSCSEYTKEMQEIKALTVYDFEGQQVVNLDENTDTNFVVLSDDTVIPESNESVNTVVSTDFDSNTFVFENADDTLKSLQKGQPLYVNTAEGASIAVTVEDITEKNGQLTVVGSDENVDEIFDVIKIEMTSTTEDCSFEPAEGSNLDKSDIQTIPFGANVDILADNQGNDEKIERGATLQFPIKYENDKKTFSVKGTFSIAVFLDVNIYKKGKYYYSDFSVSTPAKVSAEMTFKQEGDAIQDRKPFLHAFASPPIPVVLVAFEVGIDMSLSVTAKVEKSFEPTFGFRYDSDTGEAETYGKDLSDSQNTVFELSGKVTIGMYVRASFNFLNKHIFDAGLEFTVGFEITGELKATRDSDNEFESNVLISTDTAGNSVHTCGTCIDGDFNLVIELSGDIKLFNKTVAELTIAKYTKKLGDWYYSYKLGFGLGECPNIAYKLTVKINNAPDTMYVRIGNQLIDINDDNKAIAYCKSGEHTIELCDSNDKVCYSKTVNLNGKAKEITLTYKAPSSGGGGGGGGSGSWGDDYVPETTTTTTVTTTATTTTTTSTVPVAVAAGDFEGSDIHYIIWDNHHMLIYGSGDIPDTDKPFVSIDFSVEGEWYPQSACGYVYSVEIINTDENNPITKIGDSFFDNCHNIMEISIPDTVTEIGEEAFSGCGSLKEIELPKGLKRIDGRAFEYCGLERVELPEGLEYLGNAAFDHAYNLESVYIPSSLAAFGNYTFRDCEQLKEVRFSDKLNVIGDFAFENCVSLKEVKLPYGVKKLAYTFEDCRNLESVVIPDSVTELYWTFLRCPKLKDVDISKNVTDITGAFAACDSLEEIKIPDSVRTVDRTFENCMSLKSVTLPLSVSSMDTGTFWNCSSIESVTFLNPELVIQSFGGSDGDSLLRGVTIYGYNNSEAEIFANEPGYDRKFVSLGDFNSSTTTSTTTAKTTLKTETTTTTARSITTETKTNTSETTTSRTASVTSTTESSTTTKETVTTTAESTSTTAKSVTTTAESTTSGETTNSTTTASTTTESATTTTEISTQPVVEFGDPTGDGKIDAKDASFVLVEYAILSTGGESELTEEQKNAADVNKDGKTDSKDASAILTYYAYISTGGTDTILIFLKIAMT